MLKLKAALVANVPSLPTVSVEALQDEVELLRYENIVASIEHDMQSIEAMKKFGAALNATPVLSLESAALAEIAGNLLNMGPTVSDSLESHVVAGLEADDEKGKSFTEGAKALGAKLLEKIKALFKWIADKFSGDVATANKVDDDLAEAEAKMKDSEPTRAEASSKVPKNVAKFDRRGIVFDTDTSTYILPAGHATLFSGSHRKAIDGYLESAGKLLSLSTLDPKTEGDKLVESYLETLKNLSTGNVTGNLLVLDRIPMSGLYEVELPTVEEGELKSPIKYKPATNKNDAPSEVSSFNPLESVRATRKTIARIVKLLTDAKVIISTLPSGDDVSNADMYRIYSDRVIYVLILSKLVRAFKAYAKDLSVLSNIHSSKDADTLLNSKEPMTQEEFDQWMQGNVEK